MSIFFPIPFLKLLPFFLQCLHHSTFFLPTNHPGHRQRNIIEKGMTQNMERKNMGANGRRQKPKVEGRGKGEDRSGEAKERDKARNRDPIK
jgi:hypothetical protein